MTPLVSIIIPCLNAEEWIVLAIQSALESAWPNKEIIVIDDNSGDFGLNRTRMFGGKTVWEFGVNNGGNTARVSRIELARSDLIETELAAAGAPRATEFAQVSVCWAPWIRLGFLRLGLQTEGTFAFHIYDFANR